MRWDHQGWPALSWFATSSWLKTAVLLLLRFFPQVTTLHLEQGSPAELAGIQIQKPVDDTLLCQNAKQMQSMSSASRDWHLGVWGYIWWGAHV